MSDATREIPNVTDPRRPGRAWLYSVAIDDLERGARSKKLPGSHC